MTTPFPLPPAPCIIGIPFSLYEYISKSLATNGLSFWSCNMGGKLSTTKPKTPDLKSTGILVVLEDDDDGYSTVKKEEVK